MSHLLTSSVPNFVCLSSSFFHACMHWAISRQQVCAWLSVPSINHCIDNLVSRGQRNHTRRGLTFYLSSMRKKTSDGTFNGETWLRSSALSVQNQPCFPLLVHHLVPRISWHFDLSMLISLPSMF
jgi:hypothetical protein